MECLRIAGSRDTLTERVCVELASYPGLVKLGGGGGGRRRPGIHCLRMRVNFPNFRGKHHTFVLLRVTITYDDEYMFGIPLTSKLDHGSIESMVCRSSCPELSESYDSY